MPLFPFYDFRVSFANSSPWQRRILGADEAVLYKYALAGLLVAAFLTFFLAGPLLTWVGRFGSYAVLITAIGFRIAVVALVVWLALELIFRGPGHISTL